nr:unnamed protein product [Callosobruchus analis]CAI5829980.1 unnamed protein product [Callosobruchus analis]CAI5848915.1 unnamed protein product [Callosobruchus analis]CAI5869126.1 unnamed protein product [Callosobruchus analis]
MCNETLHLLSRKTAIIPL